MNLSSLIDKLAKEKEPQLRIKPGGGGGKQKEADSSSDNDAGGKSRRFEIEEDGNTMFGVGRSDSAASSASEASDSSVSTAAKRTRKRMAPPTGLMGPPPAKQGADPGPVRAPARQPARTVDADENSDVGGDEIQWSRTRPEPDWVTTPDVEIFRRLVPGTPKPPEQCVGCCYERGDSFAIHYDTWRSLNGMIAGKFRRMDRLQMAREIKKFFDKHIRGPTLPPNPVPEGCVPVPEWDLATILEHFEQHDSHPAMKRIKRSEQLSRIIDRMYAENMCYNPRSRAGRFMIDSTGKRRVRVHGASLRDFLAVCAAEERLEKLLGRDQAGGEDDIRPFLQLEGRKFVVDNIAGFDETAPDAQMGGAAQGSTVSGQGRKRRIL